MAESVTFWLNNKSSAGTKVAQLGTQILVSYRDRFFIVENGAATAKGGKPLRYSTSSLPLIWKKVLRGDTIPADTIVALAENSATPKPTRKLIARDKEVPAMTEPVPAETDKIALRVTPVAAAPKTPKKAVASKPAAQAMVATDCPYCNQKHEIPVEKGRSGKPFFQFCAKCKNDFAVRFVQVTVYQAQVAGFIAP